MRLEPQESCKAALRLDGQPEKRLHASSLESLAQGALLIRKRVDVSDPLGVLLERKFELPERGFDLRLRDPRSTPLKGFDVVVARRPGWIDWKREEKGAIDLRELPDRCQHPGDRSLQAFARHTEQLLRELRDAPFKLELLCEGTFCPRPPWLIDTVSAPMTCLLRTASMIGLRSPSTTVVLPALQRGLCPMTWN